ncbi:hypothetical protein V9T40_011971 [Parthenolecanium corni]|uniref:RNA-directed DNA polymerase n=1 Tax=Parthenolecanium corni TaxID=536013 RepID=A0AAN9Y004_9HEMI
MFDEEFVKLLENQNKMINLFLSKSEPTAPGDLSKLSIQFDSFNPKDEKFDCYLLRLENFFAIKKLSGDDAEIDKAKKQILINSIGPKYIQLLRNSTAPDDPRDKSYQDLVSILKLQLAPKTNIFSEQHKFLSRVQKQGESISKYIGALLELTLTCDWNCPQPACKKPFTQIILRAQFIRGLYDSDIRERLLQQPDQASISLEKLVEIAQSIELSKSESKEVYKNPMNTSTLHKLNVSGSEINSKNQRRTNNRRQNRPHERSSTPHRNRQQSKSRSTVDFKALGIDGHCLRCGYSNHQVKDCNHQPEKFKCKSCGRVGHVEKVCISTLLKNGEIGKNLNSKNSVSYLCYDSDDDDTVHRINLISDSNKKIFIPLQINGVNCKLECDSGSRKTVVTFKFFNSLKLRRKLSHTDALFKDYQGNYFRPLGCIQVTARYGSRKILGTMYVTDKSKISVIGLEWLIPLDILRINEIKSVSDEQIPSITQIEEDFRDVFSSTDSQAVPDYQLSYTLKKNAKPIYRKPRKVPQALIPAVDRFIDRMIAQDIYEPVDVSLWGTPVVFASKSNGDVRLCGNYKLTLNDQIENVHYQIPTIEEIFNKMEHGVYFCKIDLWEAYLHIRVDPETAKMQALSTHRGTFIVKRLYFGTKVAPNLFHQFIDQVVQNLPGTVAYFDDLLVAGDTIEICEERLRKLLQRLREKNLRVNLKKCKFFVTEIEYLGHVISKDGLHKSNKKIEAVKNAPTPKNADDVRQFLGLVNYYHRFIPSSSTLLHPLNQLLHKDQKFVWSPACNRAFIKIKEIISSDQVLTPYQQNLPLYLATDASPHGIAAILSHRFPNDGERPIAFASRSLSKSEANYSQLDREALAVFWAAKKFYYYIAGRPFTFVVDNKPIQQIFHPSKELPSFAASRMLRYAAYLSQFDYTIEHRAASKHQNVDYLSRFPIESCQLNIIDECSYLQNERLANITASATFSTETLRERTAADPELSNLLQDLKNGKNTDPDYSINDGIIFRGCRAVIPQSLQAAVLDELHSTHLGIVKMKSIARNYVFWRNIDRDIEALVKSCKNCADQKKLPPKVPLHRWEVAEKSFQRVHIDYAGPMLDRHFFIIVDSFSKWLEVYVTKNAPTSTKSINFLQDFISRFGIPEELVSDNATIFKSEEFCQFASFYQIRQRFIAPGHPATNGQAERFVQFVKNKLKKMADEPESIESKLRAILFRYRTTPTSNGKTPSQMVFGSTIRNRFDLLKPKQVTKSIKPKPTIRSFQLGERVQSRNYQSSTQWKYGTVVERLGHLHYLIELDDGYVIKRHVDQLRSTDVDLQKPVRQVSFALPHQPEPQATYTAHTTIPTSTVSDPAVPSTSFRQSPVKTTPPKQPPSVTSPVAVRPTPPVQVPLRRSSRAHKPVNRMNL